MEKKDKYKLLQRLVYHYSHHQITSSNASFTLQVTSLLDPGKASPQSAQTTV